LTVFIAPDVETAGLILLFRELF